MVVRGSRCCDAGRAADVLSRGRLHQHRQEVAASATHDFLDTASVRHVSPPRSRCVRRSVRSRSTSCVPKLLLTTAAPCQPFTTTTIILRNSLFDALRQLSGTHCRKLFSAVTLLQFLPRHAMHPRDMLWPCVCPSQVGDVLKRLNVGSHKQHRTIVQGL